MEDCVSSGMSHKWQQHIALDRFVIGTDQLGQRLCITVQDMQTLSSPSLAPAKPPSAAGRIT